MHRNRPLVLSLVSKDTVKWSIRVLDLVVSRAPEANPSSLQASEAGDEGCLWAARTVVNCLAINSILE